MDNLSSNSRSLKANARPAKVVRPRGAWRRVLPAALLLACSSARAADLYVPTGYATIASAVAAARQRTDGSTTIHVAPGIYAESGILVDVSNLTITGTVPLARDSAGYPLELGSQPAVAEIRMDLSPNTVMFQVRALNVRITSLVLDGQMDDGLVVINIDGAVSPSDGFSVDGNLIQAATSAIVSRQASGTVQGNRLTAMGFGSGIYGWSAAAPDSKKVLFSNNLVIGNANVGAVFHGGTGSGLSYPSLGAGPGKLNVEVAGNEFRGNGSDDPHNASVGLSFLLNDDSKSDPLADARITANVHDNSFVENRNWGFSVAQRISMDSRLTGYEFEGTFEHNRYCGNGHNQAIFAFRQVTNTLGVLHQFRFGRGSTYDIHAESDSLALIDIDLDHPANDPDAHDYLDPPEHENAGASLNNVLTFNGSTIPTASAPVLLRTTPVVGCALFLRANGPLANPSDLFLASAPVASTSKYRDSKAVKFAGGNAFQEIGSWQVVPPSGGVVSEGNLSTWIALKNSDDQGTRFDLQTELSRNGVIFAQGLARCVQGVTNNPDAASQEAVAPFPATTFNGVDVLKLRLLARIGTNADDSFCGGHNNATGLRLYFDSTARPSSVTVNP